MAFIIDPKTLNASAREWTLNGVHDDRASLYVIHVNVQDLRDALPDLPHDQPKQVVMARRAAWENACEKAIADDRPMPIYNDTESEKEPGLSHLRIVLQPDEL